MKRGREREVGGGKKGRENEKGGAAIIIYCSPLLLLPTPIQSDRLFLEYLPVLLPLLLLSPLSFVMTMMVWKGERKKGEKV